MNNLIMPGLPARDIHDDIFWVIIASAIFITALVPGYTTKKITSGIVSGLWTGFASGSIACLKALIFIIFGMNRLLSDPLSIAEWTAVAAKREHRIFQYILHTRSLPEQYFT